LKIALVISSLGGGGAERVVSTLANAWNREGVDVTLITLASRSADMHLLEPTIERIDLNLASPSPNTFAALTQTVVRIYRLRAALLSCAPDIVISFMTTTNMLTILSCRGLPSPVLVAERVFLSKSPPRGMWRLLYRPLYRLAAAVISQTKRGAADLEARLKRPVAVIHNPLIPAADLLRKPLKSDAVLQLRKEGKRWILAAGRLTAQKGFDLLIAAFSRVAATHPEWMLIILGEGPERSSLAAQIAQQELTDRILLPGFSGEPQALMRQADLFVLSSRYEGMPNALLEAMSIGCPCISFDCETGPAELIEHGVNSWLVPPEDVSGLATALDHLMRDADLRIRLGAKARDIEKLYSVDSILGQWNALIASVIKNGTNRASPSRKNIVTPN
jgi:GalNAc-alpha-(1->4)-GalNAc-alpha-(1->3)-diNAcBac-PP-undecaprenol alpha-1,4-N-acetyl-D-galactosaminyltransferase